MLFNAQKEDNVITVVYRALSLYKVKITRDTVCRSLKPNPDYPSLKSVCDFLKEIKVECYPVRIDEQHILKISEPFIAHLNSGGGEIILIKSISGCKITYADSLNGWKQMSTDRFLEKWSGVVIFLDPFEKSGEKDFFTKKKDERVTQRRMALLFKGNIINRTVFKAICLILFILLTKLILFKGFNVTSSSMEPTLKYSDYIIVNKIRYRTRFLKINEILKTSRLEYTRLNGIKRVKKGDVIVFNWPDYASFDRLYPNIYGKYMVKRCFGCPGDTIAVCDSAIVNLRLTIPYCRKSGKGETNYTFWGCRSENNPGMFIPKKGQTVKLTSTIVKTYQDILIFEAENVIIQDSTVYFKGKVCTEYTFKNNYYYVLGDNINESYDSRNWGLVPENNILGKVEWILFSVDLNKSGVSKINFKRFFKKVT